MCVMSRLMAGQEVVVKCEAWHQEDYLTEEQEEQRMLEARMLEFKIQIQ